MWEGNGEGLSCVCVCVRGGREVHGSTVLAPLLLNHISHGFDARVRELRRDALQELLELEDETLVVTLQLPTVSQLRRRKKSEMFSGHQDYHANAWHCS